jgi:membrane protease YdiL (CAAX protease family)
MGTLREVVSTWPKWLEALIVIVGAFGLAFVSTARYLFDSQSHAPITEHHLHFLLIYEPVIFLILGSFLYARGWTFERVGLAPRPMDPLIGVGLAVGAYAAYAALWILASAVKLQPAYLHGASSVIGGHFALPTVLAASIVNPLFEELFVCGYVITAAKQAGHLAIGINASIAIRLAYHLYQGGAGVVGIVPFGLMSASGSQERVVFGRLWSRTP